VKPFGGRRPGAFGATLAHKWGRDGASSTALPQNERIMLERLYRTTNLTFMEED
jgi:hypothetical protein